MKPWRNEEQHSDEWWRQATGRVDQRDPSSDPSRRQAFAERFPEAELLNILDDGLQEQANKAGGLTPHLADRMRRLINHVVLEGADGILLTCSMYSSVAQLAAPDLDVPSLGPNDAAFTAATILETAMGRIAQGLVERGVRRFIVAGCETSGAVVGALSVDGGLIGEEAAPGVPWIFTAGPPQLALLLKSGNFGEPDLLSEASQAGRRVHA